MRQRKQQAHARCSHLHHQHTSASRHKRLHDAPCIGRRHSLATPFQDLLQNFNMFSSEPGSLNWAVRATDLIKAISKSCPNLGLRFRVWAFNLGYLIARPYLNFQGMWARTIRYVRAIRYPGRNAHTRNRGPKFGHDSEIALIKPVERTAGTARFQCAPRIGRESYWHPQAPMRCGAPLEAGGPPSDRFRNFNMFSSGNLALRFSAPGSAARAFDIAMEWEEDDEIMHLHAVANSQIQEASELNTLLQEEGCEEEEEADAAEVAALPVAMTLPADVEVARRVFARWRAFVAERKGVLLRRLLEE